LILNGSDDLDFLGDVRLKRLIPEQFELASDFFRGPGGALRVRPCHRPAGLFNLDRPGTSPESEIKIQGGKRTIMTNFDGEKPSMQEVKQAIKRYILEEFLPGENPAELTDSTPLITGGILDSLATLKMVVFLEERFQIQIQAHETMVDYLDTVSDIAQLVSSKM